MSSIECPQCGHLALSVATRCPRCGHAFPPRPLIRHATPRRDWPSALLAGVIVVGAVLAVTLLRRPGRSPAVDGAATAPPATAPPATSQPPPVRDSPARGGSTVPPAISPGRGPGGL